MKKLILVVILVLGCGILYADVPAATANKPYLPSFEDWLGVWLKSGVAEESRDDYVGIYLPRTEDGGFKVVINVLRYDTPNGRIFITQIWPTKIRFLQAMCENWTRHGYPIDFDRDFQVTVQQATY